MPFKEKRKFIFYIICKRLESNELFENIFFPYILLNFVLKKQISIISIKSINCFFLGFHSLQVQRYAC